MSKYLYATTTDCKRVHISDAESGAHGYSCPFCGGKMIAKKGAVKAHHFAHSADYKCDEWYGNKGEWHLEMQNLFPKEYQEVILEVGGKKHIADICIPKPCGQRLIVEFQDSPMSYDEFTKRTEFWQSNGSDVIWVFNIIGKDVREVPDSYKDDEYMYQWYHAFSTLGDDLIEGVTLFFYMDPVVNTTFVDINNGYGQNRTIRGWKHSDPFLLRLTGIGAYIPDAVDDHGDYFEYRTNGYSGLRGTKCRDFLDFVKKRVEYFHQIPVKAPKGDIWVAFKNKKEYEKDKYLSYLSNLLSKPASWCNSIIIYLREERCIRQTYVFYPDRFALIHKLKTLYGEKNVVIKE